MEENQSTPMSPQREKSIFDVIYLVVLAAVIGYAIYVYGFKFDNYSEDQLMNMSYYLVPPLFFGIFGMITVKSTRSMIYAIVAAVVSFGLLVAFYQGIWPML